MLFPLSPLKDSNIQEKPPGLTKLRLSVRQKFVKNLPTGIYLFCAHLAFLDQNMWIRLILFIE
jgi:hypothetical protein